MQKIQQTEKGGKTKETLKNTGRNTRNTGDAGLTEGGSRTDELATSRREKHRLNYTETH